MTLQELLDMFMGPFSGKVQTNSEPIPESEPEPTPESELNIEGSIDWSVVNGEYQAAFTKDVDILDWYGHSLKIRRTQQWDNGRCLTPEESVKDIYLDYPWVAKGWREHYGTTPTLSDFMDFHLNDGPVISLAARNDYYIYAGKASCRYMHYDTHAALQLCLRLIQSHYPNPDNPLTVLGDAGCEIDGTCAGHVGAHDSQKVVDGNYFTKIGCNITQYQVDDDLVRPDPYALRQRVNFWNDRFPYRDLNVKRFDVEKNYSLFELLYRVFGEPVLVSQGIYEWYQSNGYDVSCLHGDDVESYHHYWHWHSFLPKLNRDAEMTVTLR